MAAILQLAPVFHPFDGLRLILEVAKSDSLLAREQRDVIVRHAHFNGITHQGDPVRRIRCELLEGLEDTVSFDREQGFRRAHMHEDAGAAVLHAFDNHCAKKPSCFFGGFPFAEGYRGQPVAPQVLHQAKRAVIDWYAALLPGGVVPPALLLERALAGELDHGEARLALGKRAGVRSAALINGAAAHTVEVDDIFREVIYHPGAPTVAAALAVAQSRQVSGEAFLRAVIVGYEISTRIAEAMGRAHYRYWHNTGTIGCFGAASAAAEVLGLDAKRFAHALATVATFSAGLQQAFRADSMSKPMHAGRAAESGVTAALAAGEGVTGSLDIMEGEAGFGKAMGEDPDWERAPATPGEGFHIC